MKASITLDHALVQRRGRHHHAMLELTAADVDTDRPPLRLAVVIDRSGSMTGDRLETAKQATAMLADRLAGDDQLAAMARTAASEQGITTTNIARPSTRSC